MKARPSAAPKIRAPAVRPKTPQMRAPKVSPNIRKGIRTATPIKPVAARKPRMPVSRPEFVKRVKNGFKFQSAIRPDLARRHGKVFPEVNTVGKNGRIKRVDYVTRGRTPISVKNSRWDKVQFGTLRGYVNEATYPNRRIGNSRNVTAAMRGRSLGEKRYLSVPRRPITAVTRPRLDQFKALAKQKGVTLSFHKPR